jgi:hypothetical protein
MVYTWRKDIDLFILFMYVDDLIITGISSSMIQSVQRALMG